MTAEPPRFAVFSFPFSSVQLLSHVQLFVTPWTAARQASLSITNSWRLLKLMSIKSRMPSNHLILCCPLFLLPSIFPRIRVFSNESVLHIRWPMYWNFSFSISPSNEYSGLISFRMDWLDLLAVQGTLKSLLQHHSSKASLLWCSAFFMVQLSHPYMTTRKTIALTRQTFVGKVMSHYICFDFLETLVPWSSWFTFLLLFLASPSPQMTPDFLADHLAPALTSTFYSLAPSSSVASQTTLQAWLSVTICLPAYLITREKCLNFAENTYKSSSFSWALSNYLNSFSAWFPCQLLLLFSH